MQKKNYTGILTAVLLFTICVMYQHHHTQTVVSVTLVHRELARCPLTTLMSAWMSRSSSTCAIFSCRSRSISCLYSFRCFSSDSRASNSILRRDLIFCICTVLFLQPVAAQSKRQTYSRCQVVHHRYKRRQTEKWFLIWIKVRKKNPKTVISVFHVTLCTGATPMRELTLGTDFKHNEQSLQRWITVLIK